MIEWLKDLLGINRYKVVWDFHGPSGFHHKGEHGPMRKGLARSVVNDLNNDGLNRFYWIERAD